MLGGLAGEPGVLGVLGVRGVGEEDWGGTACVCVCVCVCVCLICFDKQPGLSKLIKTKIEIRKRL